jgi:hypothetical protein
LHITFIYEHFPKTIDGLLNFRESDSIYASDEGVVVPHSVYSDILHREIGQFIESLFENNCVDNYTILIKGETWMNEIYFSIYAIDDTF